MLDNLTINVPEIPKCLDNALNNLLDSPTKEIGNIFSDCLNLVFGNVHYLSEKRNIYNSHRLEEFQKSLQDNIDKIPADKITIPNERNLCEILKNSVYSLSEVELRECFAKLAAGTIHADKRDLSLPTFGHFLATLTPLDCLVFKEVMRHDNFPLIALREYDADGLKRGIVLEHLSILTKYSYEAVSLSLSVLKSFGLIDIPSIGYPVPENLYHFVTDTPEFQSYLSQKQRELPLGHVIKPVHEGGVAKTSLGIAFYDACIA